MAIKREDPAPSGSKGRTSWQEVFETVRAEPQVWFNVGNYPAAYVTSIRAGKFKGNTGDFEATMRDTDAKTQRGTLYVRFVGEG